LKRKYNLLIGERTGEQIKMQLVRLSADKPLSIGQGRNLIRRAKLRSTIGIREASQSAPDHH
jgi:actin-like ATPase involved in cell morphogenesis